MGLLLLNYYVQCNQYYPNINSHCRHFFLPHINRPINIKVAILETDPISSKLWTLELYLRSIFLLKNYLFRSFNFDREPFPRRILRDPNLRVCCGVWDDKFKPKKQQTVCRKPNLLKALKQNQKYLQSLRCWYQTGSKKLSKSVPKILT